jgi:hypothetical protein
MGIFDKIKGAVKAVTGSTAKITLEAPATLYPGEAVQVRITATSTGGEVKSKGVFIDLSCNEIIKFRSISVNNNEPIDFTDTVYEKEVKIAPEFVLAPNETKTWSVELPVPGDCKVTYEGKNCKNQWKLRGRIEAVGTDPASDWMDIRVGLKS